MSGFEVIVRPVVFPNIRPAPSRSLPPEDDAESGRTVLSGSSGTVIALTHSFSANGTMPGGREIERTYDTVRIGPVGGQSGPEGRNKATRAAGDDDAYIDVEVVKSVRMRGYDGSMSRYDYAPMQEAANITIIQHDMVRSS